LILSKMQHIDRNKLYSDLGYRFDYVSKFMGFGAEDIKAIKASAPFVAPLVPTIVNAVYNKLFSFDITREIFVERNHGFEGHIPKDVNEVTLESEQVRFRMDGLTKYLVKLVTAEYNAEFVQYLDLVGKIHTGHHGSNKINVEYIHINALLGYVSDIVLGAIITAELDPKTKTATALAFNKLLWIQNDLFAKYYVRDGNEVKSPEVHHTVHSKYTMEEVKKHSTKEDCWTVIKGRVYDVTKFVNEHPGGDVILDGAGKDSTSMFEDVGHSSIAEETREQYYIGDIKN